MHKMEHNGDIKKVLYLIEQGLTELSDDDSVKPVFFEQQPNVSEILKDLKDLQYKIDSFNVVEGNLHYREGLLAGLQFSSQLIENLIRKHEDQE